MQCIPLDTDVVHKFRLHIEIGNEILRPVTDINSVMSIRAVRVGPHRPAGTRGQPHIAHGAEIRGIQVDGKVTILDFNIINPTLRDIMKKESVVSPLLKVTGGKRSTENEWRDVRRRPPESKEQIYGFRVPTPDARHRAKESILQAARGVDPATEKKREGLAETFEELTQEYTSAPRVSSRRVGHPAFEERWLLGEPLP